MQFVTYLQNSDGQRVEVVPVFKDDGMSSTEFVYFIQNSDQKPPEILKIPVASIMGMAETIPKAVSKLAELSKNKCDDPEDKVYV